MLFLTVHRAPAPIVEEPVATATPRPKQSRMPSDSKAPTETFKTESTRQFEGTWRGGTKSTNEKGFGLQMTVMLIIKDNNALYTITATNTLPAAGGTWDNLPAPYNTITTIYNEQVFKSTDLKYVDRQLVIRWQAGRLTDWRPKEIPNGVIQTAFTSILAPWALTCTRRHDQLIITEGKNTQPLDRVR